MEVQALEEAMGVVSEAVPKPQIKVLEEAETYGKFSVEPLERGYAITLGNPLRRVLLSSIPGTAVTWIKIDGAMHEYSTLPHVKEDVTELLLNVKSIRIKSLVERSGKLRLEVKGEGKVCAGDISTSSEFEIVNPELHLATLDSPEADLSVELNVEQGKGYIPASEREGFPIGTLPVDAIFTPVRRVNYATERTRVGQRTDYERLVLEVWTDGTIAPVEAVRQSAQFLLDHFHLFLNVGKEAGAGGEKRTSRATHLTPEQYRMPLEKLELSSRTLNCLKRARLNTVGEVLEKEEAELLEIRNFGEKSLEELHGRLRALGLLSPESTSEVARPTVETSGPASEEEMP